MTQENTSADEIHRGCPNCGADHHDVRAERESIPYGAHGKSVSAIIPVRTCKSCEFQWSDENCEVIRDFAVKEAMERDALAPSAQEANPTNLPPALGATVEEALRKALEVRGYRTDGDTLALARRCHFAAMEDRDVFNMQKALTNRYKGKLDALTTGATPDSAGEQPSEQLPPITPDQKRLTFEQHTALHGSRADVLVRQAMVHLGYLRGEKAPRRSEVCDKMRGLIEELEVMAQRANLGVLPVSVDDLVEAWHNGAGGGVALHEFLGLTKEQYARWVADPSSVTVPGPLTEECVLQLRDESARATAGQDEQSRTLHFAHSVMALTIRRLCETPPVGMEHTA